MTPPPVSPHVTSPAPRSTWEELAQADPEALPEQTPQWMDIVCRSAKASDASRYYEFPDGQRLVMPLARNNAPTRLATQGSMPAAWGIGGPLASSPLEPSHIVSVLEDLQRQPVLRTTIRPNPRHGSAWAAACPPAVVALSRTAHVLDLDGGFDHVWSERFHSKTRNKIRVAERAGLDVEHGSELRLAEEFYRLFRQSVERWAQQQNEPLWLARRRAEARDPIDKIKNMVEGMGGKCRVWVARVDGEPAAAIVTLVGRNVHYTRGAMNKELAGRTQANSLLLSLAIEGACADGARWFHMGESGGSRPLAQFKERFGCDAYDYAEYRIERLPITKVDAAARSTIKKVIGFRDTPDSDS